VEVTWVAFMISGRGELRCDTLAFRAKTEFKPGGILLAATEASVSQLSLNLVSGWHVSPSRSA
jgi:hypothetical protein